MITETISAPSFYKLELRTAYGPVYRDVLNTAPHDCHPDEVPVIDLTPLFSKSLDDRKALAKTINQVAEGTGFFYIKAHGIPETVIAVALAVQDLLPPAGRAQDEGRPEDLLQVVQHRLVNDSIQSIVTPRWSGSTAVHQVPRWNRMIEAMDRVDWIESMISTMLSHREQQGYRLL